MATNAAIETTSVIGAVLTLAGITNSTAASTSAKAIVDGWLGSALKPQANTFQAGSQLVAPSTSAVLTSTAWTFTPTCPKDTLVTAQLSGYTTTASGLFALSLVLDAFTLKTINFGINTTGAHTTFPAIQFVIPAASITYPLAAQTLKFAIATPAGTNFLIDAGDVVSYSIS